jgi:hypothetical protein
MNRRTVIFRTEGITAKVEYKFRWRQHGASKRKNDQGGKNY